MVTENKEVLLIPRAKVGDPIAEQKEEMISKYEVGSLYQTTRSTTSPPAFVYNTYEVTRKDYQGLWGILVDSTVREMEPWEV